MSNKEYYERWLKIKEQLKTAVEEDERLQQLATTFIGIKPQRTAVEIVARAYCKYCELYNKLCDCYDQMEQVQRRTDIKKIIDAITCRLLELKTTLEKVEVFEYTYPDNVLQQMLMVPQDIKILCPFFYPFEIRRQEMQYIIDEIFAGNRIGDPKPTPTELERRIEHKIEEDPNKQEQKEVEFRGNKGQSEYIPVIEEEVDLTPAQRAEKQYKLHVNTIQRMERARDTTREIVRKNNKDADLYLELAALKAPSAPEHLQQRASKLIQLIYRRFMELKRHHMRDTMLKEKLGMVMPAYKPPSAQVQLERVKETRRNFRCKYYKDWLKANVKENTKVLKLRAGDIMEDISDEIRQWFREWYNELGLFDEFPWPGEGGSILVVKGETFSIEDFIEWRKEEEKRLKSEAGNPKSKEQIKAEKLLAKQEKKKSSMEAKEKEKKRLLDYKKQRLNPENDPGVYLAIGKQINPVLEAWNGYESQWKSIDVSDPPLEATRGYIKYLITENAYQDIQFQLRPVVDEMMRLELELLKSALKADCLFVGIKKPPQSKKRKNPRIPKPPNPDKKKPEMMFQKLVDAGIVRKYPKILLDNYWGDRNYAAADMRAVLWTPSFPPPCMGDVREQVRTRCLLTLGSSCPNASRSQLLVGSKHSGKKTLVYAIATETNSILIDLSPLNVYNKFPGPKNLKTMLQYVIKISKLMQPTVILIENADKIFLKKVPKEEKIFDPTRLSKDLFKEIIKNIGYNDKILVLGTATEPWMSKGPKMYKIFPSLILIPRTDYGSISYILTHMLMQYHGVNREFNVHSLAQALRGYDINSIRKHIHGLLNGKRVAELYHKPLKPLELLSSIIKDEEAVYMDNFDVMMFQEWYLSYSPWGQQYMDYMIMLNSQLAYKLKQEKNKIK